jgi:hypothetical protein
MDRKQGWPWRACGCDRGKGMGWGGGGGGEGEPRSGRSRPSNAPNGTATAGTRRARGLGVGHEAGTATRGSGLGRGGSTARGGSRRCGLALCTGTASTRQKPSVKQAGCGQPTSQRDGAAHPGDAQRGCPPRHSAACSSEAVRDGKWGPVAGGLGDEAVQGANPAGAVLRCKGQQGGGCLARPTACQCLGTYWTRPPWQREPRP